MRYSLLMLLGCAISPAQEGPVAEPDTVTDQTTQAAAPDAYVPLTLGQSYLWSLHQVFAPGWLFLVAARAAIDHSRDDPSGWGQGTEGYAERVASRLGRAAVRENIAFAVRALDHEDPRYFRSRQAGFWKRTRYAAGQTFVSRNERGVTMPAYSLLVADFATPFIAQTWRPEQVNTGREIRGGGIAMGMTAISNIGQEFWPDVRRKLQSIKPLWPLLTALPIQ